jgi:hypothetical protein
LADFFPPNGKLFANAKAAACVDQVLAHRARFKADPLNRMWEVCKALSDVADLTGQFALQQHRPLAINNAKRTGS